MTLSDHTAIQMDSLDQGQNARIASVAWDRLADEDGKRLRALGLDIGAEVSLAHRGVFGARDPLAITIGRMTIALRREHAAAMTIELL